MPLPKLDVKPGDEIYIPDCSMYGPGRIATVDRLTPSGRIIVGGQTFDPDGTERGQAGWRPVRICLPTDELREKIRRHDLLNKLKGVVWDIQPLAVLEQVWALIPPKKV